MLNDECRMMNVEHVGCRYIEHTLLIIHYSLYIIHYIDYYQPK